MQAFLNTLSADEAKAWKQEIVTSLYYVKLINYRHLLSTLNVDQFKLLTSITPYDGKKLSHMLKIFNFNFILGAFFEKWMKCEIKQEHLNNPPPLYPRCCNLREWFKFAINSKII
jgi:hypothetical protein